MKLDDVLYRLDCLLNGLKCQMAEPPTHILLGADVEDMVWMIFGSHTSPPDGPCRTVFGLPVLRGPDGCIAVGWCKEA